MGGLIYKTEQRCSSLHEKMVDMGTNLKAKEDENDYLKSEIENLKLQLEKANIQVDIKSMENQRNLNLQKTDDSKISNMENDKNISRNDESNEADAKTTGNFGKSREENGSAKGK